jgi:hypothetical protein
MTIRSFNYTGRKRIERNDITIALRHDRRPLEFDATLNLAAYEFPLDAEVLVEAYYRSSAAHMRFSFGKVASIVAPSDRRLTEIDSEIVFFNVKVVDATNGQQRIVGLAEKIEAGQIEPSVGSRFNLLPVNFVPLGDQVWNVKLDPLPILEVNSQIEGMRELVHNRMFFGCVYPEVVRKVLTAAAADGIDDDVDEQWRAMWLRYGRTLARAPESADPDGIATWVEDVVEAFARRHNVRAQFVAGVAEVMS